MTLIDLTIIVVYMVGIVVVGIAYRGRQDNIRDYFTAQDGFKGVLGMVMVGLSLGATLFSGLSFVAFPSMFFTYGITVLTGLVCFPLAYVLLRFWFLPRYLAVPQDSPYDIIERRFGRSTRLVASAMFVVLRLCWMAALIYVPALVVMAALQLSREWFWPLILIIGLSSTIYTVAGGIRGVIVTDAIQFLIIIAVLTATVGYIVIEIPLSVGEMSTYLQTNTNLLDLNWSLDPTITMTVAAMVIGSTFQNMSSFAADQMSLQRYLASGGAKPAAAAFGTSMLTTTVVLTMLAMVGLAIGAWYHVHPDPALPQNPDKVFPYFIATQLPVGFMGMVVAAILAATMSSITSGINALSGSLLNDFVPFSGRVESKRLLFYARLTSAIIGAAATIGSGFVDRMGSLFNIMNVFYGVFLGPLLACMICTLSKGRVQGRVLVPAMFIGCISGVAVAYSSIANLWVSAISCGVTYFVAVIGSKLLPPSRSRV